MNEDLYNTNEVLFPCDPRRSGGMPSSSFLCPCRRSLIKERSIARRHRPPYQGAAQGMYVRHPGETVRRRSAGGARQRPAASPSVRTGICIPICVAVSATGDGVPQCQSAMMTTESYGETIELVRWYRSHTVICWSAI